MKWLPFQRLRHLFVLLMGLFLIAGHNPAQAQSKGVQLVLLPYWSDKSVENFLSVATSPQAPKTIEIGFAPYLQPSDAPFPPPSNYVNMRKIVDRLRAAGKNVIVTVHLSFHAKGSGMDAEIKRNAKDFNKNFAGDYVDKVTLNVSPSLEDEGSNADFQRWEKILEDNIDKNMLSKINLRRSPINANGTTKGSFKSVQVEYHGAITGSGNDYSNDGNFVYYPNGGEDANSLQGSNPSPQYRLDGFIAGVSGLKNTVLLWRPAYNLFRKESSGGKVKFFKTNRNFTDKQITFDGVEKEVLKHFFGVY